MERDPSDIEALRRVEQLKEEKERWEKEYFYAFTDRTAQVENHEVEPAKVDLAQTERRNAFMANMDERDRERESGRSH